MPPKTNCVVCLSFILCAAVHAQHFSVKGKLEPVNKTGFYTINITPELSAHMATDFRDLRIADEDEKVIQYILATDQPSFINYNYSQLPILKNEVADSGRSVLIIENTAQRNISSIALLIRNAAVTRNSTISGSDDMDRWFTIAEDIYFEKKFTDKTDKYVQTIRFPVSSYKYLKITIANGRNNPLNIMEAGMYVDDKNNSSYPYTRNPSPSFLQTDSSDHNSYIKVTQPAPFHIDKVTLEIKGPKFFKRDVDILTRKGGSTLQLSSGSIFFYMPTFNDRTWTIRIHNGDNPPLVIDSVLTEQESRKIIAWFEAGKNYHLLMGDSAATPPVYDLQQFKDSIPVSIPQLKILAVEKVDQNAAQPKQLIPSEWMWPAIVIMLAVLAFFTLRLTKEVQRKKS